MRSFSFLPHQLRREHLPKVLGKHIPALLQWWSKCFIGEGRRLGHCEQDGTIAITTWSYTPLSLHPVPDERAELAEQMGLLYPMAGPSFEEALSEVVDPDTLIASVEEEIQRCKDLFKQQADLFKAVACIESYRVGRGRSLWVGPGRFF